MKILHVMRSVDPEGGGPIEALVQSDPVWRRLGHTREIVSLDLPEDPWVARCPIPTHALGSRATKRWARRVPALRYGFAPALVSWLRANLAAYDIVVVNGLWNFAAFAARCVLPKQRKPYVVFTHGMLDPWFRHAHPLKHWAKQVSWLVNEGPLLRGARAVLFTSRGEQDGADGAFWPYRVAGRISGYGTAAAPLASPTIAAAREAAIPTLAGRRFLLFLGRLHPKKGCDLLIQAFATVASARPDVDLVIAGPDSGGYRRTLEALALTCGVAGRVHWPGMLRGDAKWGAFHGCEAFVLPSHGENFGVAVVEALACGKPVLISDRVAIADEIAAAAAGLVAPDTTPGTAGLLQRFLALSDEACGVMGRQAQQCFLQSFHIERVAADALACLEASLRP